ncbi:MAG: hypothetical protein D6743_08430 [Calditrichaeota bacterium]|nr:MAG: hypothetical protein D6743_08430 [Calditrichota bacterium]
MDSSQNVVAPKIIVGVAEYNRRVPIAKLYLDHVIKRVMRQLKENTFIQFVGHACAIGSAKNNQRLSEGRARDFKTLFLRAARRRDPKIYRKLRASLLPDSSAVGKGEQEPLKFRNVPRKGLLQAIKQRNPQEYREIMAAIHRGETRIARDPFILEIGQETITIISRNDRVYGRQINRRIEIAFRQRPQFTGFPRN